MSKLNVIVIRLVVTLFTSVTSFAQEGSFDRGGGAPGGGYAHDNSYKVLQQATDELIAAIEKTESNLFKTYGLDREEIKFLIQRMVLEPTKQVTRPRPGRTNQKITIEEPLMFYYGPINDGPFLEAPHIEVLKPFFDGYANIGDGLRGSVIRDVQIKILHEATHHFKIGIHDNSESDRVARGLIEKLIPSQEEALANSSDLEILNSRCVANKLTFANSIDDRLQGTVIERLSQNGWMINEPSNQKQEAEEVELLVNMAVTFNESEGRYTDTGLFDDYGFFGKYGVMGRSFPDLMATAKRPVAYDVSGKCSVSVAIHKKINIWTTKNSKSKNRTITSYFKQSPMMEFEYGVNTNVGAGVTSFGGGLLPLSRVDPGFVKEKNAKECIAKIYQDSNFLEQVQNLVPKCK